MWNHLGLVGDSQVSKGSQESLDRQELYLKKHISRDTNQRKQKPTNLEIARFPSAQPWGSEQGRLDTVYTRSPPLSRRPLEDPYRSPRLPFPVPVLASHANTRA